MLFLQNFHSHRHWYMTDILTFWLLNDCLILAYCMEKWFANYQDIIIHANVFSIKVMSVIIMTDKVYACKSINNGQGRSARERYCAYERYIQRVAIRSYQATYFISKQVDPTRLAATSIYLFRNWLAYLISHSRP